MFHNQRTHNLYQYLIENGYQAVLSTRISNQINVDTLTININGPILETIYEDIEANYTMYHIHYQFEDIKSYLDRYLIKQEIINKTLIIKQTISDIITTHGYLVRETYKYNGIVIKPEDMSLLNVYLQIFYEESVIKITNETQAYVNETQVYVFDLCDPQIFKNIIKTVITLFKIKPSLLSLICEIPN